MVRHSLTIVLIIDRSPYLIQNLYHRATCVLAFSILSLPLPSSQPSLFPKKNVRWRGEGGGKGIREKGPSVGSAPLPSGGLLLPLQSCAGVLLAGSPLYFQRWSQIGSNFGLKSNPHSTPFTLANKKKLRHLRGK